MNAARRRTPLPEIGATFGRWTVLDYANGSVDSGNHVLVGVICVCGEYEARRLTALIRGESTGCRACARADVAARFERVAVGATFGRWTVLEHAPRSRDGNLMVRVRCGGCERDFTRKESEIKFSSRICAACALASNKKKGFNCK